MALYDRTELDLDLKLSPLHEGGGWVAPQGDIHCGGESAYDSCQHSLAAMYMCDMSPA